jgi:4-diphosphocytidyl-2-C-methyl-D-erythritol kinase
LYQLIDLHDLVEITAADSTRIICTDSSLSGDSNLAAKALRMLSEWINVPSLRIFIDKRIPIEAGLGGGSSDAAAVLWAVNEILDRPLHTPDLLQIGAACGSDVPFFIHRSPRAVGTGRGEQIQPIDAEPEVPIVLAKPPVGCSTAKMYADLDVHSGAVPPDDLSFHQNDFDAIAPSESRELIKRMNGHLCGSGSAVYSQAPDTTTAMQMARDLQSAGYWALATNTLQKLTETEWIQ